MLGHRATLLIYLFRLICKNGRFVGCLWCFETHITLPFHCAKWTTSPTLTPVNWLHPQCEAAITSQVILCLPSFWHPIPISCRLFGQGLVSECDYGRWYKQRRVMDLAFSRRWACWDGPCLARGSAGWRGRFGGEASFRSFTQLKRCLGTSEVRRDSWERPPYG